MNVFIKLYIVVLIVFVQSCKANKTIDNSENPESETPTVLHDKLINDGYLIGTVIYLEKSKCSYIIIDEKTNTKYDPINIDEDKFSEFKTNKSTIYYKYRLLRMMNRCNNANPIQLVDVKKRM